MRSWHAFSFTGKRVFAGLAIVALSGAWQSAQATVINIPQSALIPSTTYYTDSIGGGVGEVVVTTGGGNAANVGAANGRNDDRFRGPANLGFNGPFFSGVVNDHHIWFDPNLAPVTATLEPATLLLFGATSAGLALARGRRRNRV